ncbi:alpha/beta-hydrolase [Aaosphaeria arxii CBS 175.79]|uniref:Alpha/beta-hydrolase n=1 Tax=Aaosphaeria arxii CBS 175.79 TaxID=1450172 RepID=A0A6A5Y7Q6_9PLEO|nr:alpha/beta-hydrolase [Aaosphaeria arxii CBS 175.79]KAF2021263.1 alpha/beta-hydrolase [Aaosphaeria arxii CBS 175.79]
MATSTLDDLSTKMESSPIESGTNSSIRITHRSERYFYMHLVQIIVRRIRSHLVKPKKEQREGSIKLKPQKVIYRTCSVNHRTICDINIYDIIPKRTSEKTYVKRIYYFCGGGWQSPPSGQHWQVCAKLARQMPDTTISIVSYPLAPKNSASKSFPALLRLYRELLRQSEEDGHRVILAGDSSGGNIVLSLVLEALREDAMEAGGEISRDGKRSHTAHPTALMLVCPSTDLTRSNPDIEKLKHADPILTPDFIKETAGAWTGDWDPKDPRVSPLYADLSLLAKRGIKVHGVTGGYDILRPDAIMLREKLEKEGVHGEWLDWDKQMHCFVLTWPYGMREGREGVGWMVDVLKKE